MENKHQFTKVLAALPDPNKYPNEKINIIRINDYRPSIWEEALIHRSIFTEWSFTKSINEQGKYYWRLN